ncbi:MAG: helix-turn-helix domain-containing protein [Armatimonadota bacterium]
MKNLQEWMRYVESQSEAAKRKISGQKEPPPSQQEQAGESRDHASKGLAKTLISWAQTAPEEIIAPAKPKPSMQTSSPAKSAADVIRYIPVLREVSGISASQTPKTNREQTPASAVPAASEDESERPLRTADERQNSTAQPSIQEKSPAHPAEDTADWHKLPRQLQILLSSLKDEVASHYYKSFRETREELIRRLLDPELTLEDTARILGVCPMTVRRYTNKGLLPHHRTPGNQRRFRLSDVLEFMEKRGAFKKGNPNADETTD